MSNASSTPNPDAPCSAAATPVDTALQRVWQRHTLREKLARTALWLAIGLAVLASMNVTPFSIYARFLSRRALSSFSYSFISILLSP